VAKSVPIGRSWVPISENADHQPKKRTIQPGKTFEDTAFKPGFEILKF
jgi:hypothetical protein